MKTISLFFLTFLFLNINSKYLSEEELTHQQNLVTKINSLKITWTAEVYPIDVKPLLGVLLDPETNSFQKERLSIPRRNVTPIPDLPENYDLRDIYSYCDSLFEIRDQANCGSCWAVASVETMSDRHCIISKGVQKPILSASVVISCCGLCGKGCAGYESSTSGSYDLRI